MSDVSRFSNLISLAAWVACSSVLTVIATSASSSNPAQANPVNSQSAQEIAAISQPSNSVVLTEKSQPMTQSEADLIQQLSGQSAL
jgi:hypothetical protein